MFNVFVKLKWFLKLYRKQYTIAIVLLIFGELYRSLAAMDFRGSH